MFHISFLVRDKHLADTLRSLTDRAMNLEVKPATAEAIPEEKPTPDRVPLRKSALDFLNQQGAEEFVVDQLAAFTNYSKSSCYTELNLLTDEGIVASRKETKGKMRFRKVFPNSQLIHKSDLEPAA